jgi:hypothetical protein
MAMRFSALARVRPSRDILATWREYPVGAWLESRVWHGAGFGFRERLPAVEPVVTPVYGRIAEVRAACRNLGTEVATTS